MGVLFHFIQRIGTVPPMKKSLNFMPHLHLLALLTLESVLYEAIALEKNQHPEHFIVVLAHWGVDFLPTHAYQKRIAKRLMTVGTDLILGHGAHTLQSIDSIDEKTVVYSLGNGIFNSDGEYDGYPTLYHLA